MDRRMQLTNLFFRHCIVTITIKLVSFHFCTNNYQKLFKTTISIILKERKSEKRFFPKYINV